MNSTIGIFNEIIRFLRESEINLLQGFCIAIGVFAVELVLIWKRNRMAFYLSNFVKFSFLTVQLSFMPFVALAPQMNAMFNQALYTVTLITLFDYALAIFGSQLQTPEVDNLKRRIDALEKQFKEIHEGGILKH